MSDDTRSNKDGRRAFLHGAARKPARGFTVVELVVVIVIIGVLSAVAMPRFFNDRSFAERGYFEALAAALKLAQRVAVATGCPVRVSVTAGGYDARQQAPAGSRCDTSDATWPVAVQTIDGSPLAASAPAGVTASPATTLVFNALGTTDLAVNRTISVGAHSLTVQAASGYVQVN